MQIKNVVLFCLLLAILLAVSGCLNAEIETKVNKDFSGTRSVHLEMAPLVYNYMKDEISKDSFESNTEIGLVKYEMTTDDDNIVLDIIYEVNDFNRLDTIEVYKNEETLIFKDKVFEKASSRKAKMDDMSIEYILEMPGEIIDSNADYVDGKTAVWNNYLPGTIYAESKVPTIPGFSIVSSLIAGILVFVLVTRQRKNQEI